MAVMCSFVLSNNDRIKGMSFAVTENADSNIFAFEKGMLKQKQLHEQKLIKLTIGANICIFLDKKTSQKSFLAKSFCLKNTYISTNGQFYQLFTMNMLLNVLQMLSNYTSSSVDENSLMTSR